MFFCHPSPTTTLGKHGTRFRLRLVTQALDSSWSRFSQSRYGLISEIVFDDFLKRIGSLFFQRRFPHIRAHLLFNRLMCQRISFSSLSWLSSYLLVQIPSCIKQPDQSCGLREHGASTTSHVICNCCPRSFSSCQCLSDGLATICFPSSNADRVWLDRAYTYTFRARRFKVEGISVD